MYLRRTAAALTATAALAAVAAPVAAADESPSPKGLPAGLYGKGDPQYDGVLRQSVALLAQDAAGVTPAKQALDWLAGQQCEDGAFPAYRPDAGTPCGAKDKPESNATAAAVQALAATGGHPDVVEPAVEWLKSVQNDDGGWGFHPGDPEAGDSDANSTALVVGALVAAGDKPADVRKGGRSPYDALRALQLGCDADADKRGAFAHQPDADGTLSANDLATAAATTAAAGRGLVVPPAENGDGGDGGDTAVEAPSCDDGDSYRQQDSAAAAAAYLHGVLQKNGDHLMSSFAGAEDQPDHGTTSLAVLALAAAGYPEAARGPLGWLEKNLDGWDRATEDPAALGQLVLGVHATGGDPTAFGGADLVERLNATGPEPAAAEGTGGTGGKPADSDADGEQSDSSEDGSGVAWWTVGAVLVAGVGVGLLVSLRNKKKQDS
ncbi:prenyltransferase/squalene oxidase repeat-containing protein [Streptomyces sp. 549]|uniref:prenyltransferase/squalene oxidase repeat-containing protein n=1 Tax=Streptomyces sp. 549 TaxID=3049076 RepID=UPI0024C34DF8|nr:prenyltransferase/squalene oxidase repeat-containing protein [Streptomyces sp. 549]MDK1474008.1 prenyltransferase/squalene oxidase repeat-containing protein [Streptomyces sp. 549]